MTNKSIYLLPSFLLLAISTLAFKRDTFEIKKIHQSIGPATRKYIQYTETGAGTINFNALLTRSIEKTIYNGKEAWLIIQQYQSAKAIDRDSSYCDLYTLRPLAYFTDIQSELHQEQVLFRGNSIDNKIIFKDSTKQTMQADNGFYNGVMTDELIAALPLEQNKQFILKTVNPGLRYFEYVTTVFVEDKELISLSAAGPVWCWRVRVTTGNTFTLQWYTVKGHEQVKKKYSMKNGNTFIRVAVSG